MLASEDPGKIDKSHILNPSKNTIKVIQKGKGSLFVNGKLKYFWMATVLRLVILKRT